MGVGLAANYHLFQFDHVRLENDDFENVSLSPETMRGFGAEIPFSLIHYWFSFGFSWTKGDLPIEAPACSSTSPSSDCLPAGTKVQGSLNGYHIPFLLGGRLPFRHGAALLGSGFELNLIPR